jgi:hypothetical protein
MKTEDHLAIDKIVFGEEFPEVHKWLDELYTESLGFNHWLMRHHLWAIERKYPEGTNGYLVALLHVTVDWLSHLRMFEVPVNSAEVGELLLSLVG